MPKPLFAVATRRVPSEDEATDDQPTSGAIFRAHVEPESDEVYIPAPLAEATIRCVPSEDEATDTQFEVGTTVRVHVEPELDEMYTPPPNTPAIRCVPSEDEATEAQRILGALVRVQLMPMSFGWVLAEQLISDKAKNRMAGNNSDFPMDGIYLISSSQDLQLSSKILYHVAISSIWKMALRATPFKYDNPMVLNLKTRRL
ncbi:MAG: hypothetical protein KGJ09_09830 [Candidatus Omnitrophica bacterium]|nr:hypothetical protein [Candidatus Omnitrophota bacterium]MDE2232240.1 hypothetical protein [Candidatus Omnitrophota bacterium]